MIEVTKRKDEQFPIGCAFNGKPMQKFTLDAARNKVADFIEGHANLEEPYAF